MLFHVRQGLCFQVTRILARKASRTTHIKESKHLSLFSRALEVLILAVRSGQVITGIVYLLSISTQITIYSRLEDSYFGSRWMDVSVKPLTKNSGRYLII